MYVVNSFNVCGKSVSVFLTSTVYTVNPRFAFIRGGRFILSLLNSIFIDVDDCVFILKNDFIKCKMNSYA